MLSVKKLESLTHANHGEKIRDDGGLIGTVYAREDGISVFFSWRYRFNKKIREIAIGKWPQKSLATIRAERNQHRYTLESGKDPAEERRATRLSAKADQAEAIEREQRRITDVAQRSARLTVNKLFEQWATTELIRHKDNGKEVRRMFEKDVLPNIGELAVEDVRKAHIAALNSAVLARGVSRMAKVIFALVRQMFRYAQDMDIIENDPTASIRKNKIGGKDKERDRVLSEREISELSKKLQDANMTEPAQCAIWLCLSTCCRIGELLKAKWADVRLDEGEWFVPPENSKNGKAHTIYLSPFAIEQFRKLQTTSNDSKYCYPNRANNNHVCQKTITKQLADRQRDAPPMKNRAATTDALKLPGGYWSSHDLRRTGATMMVALGALPEVAERCLNHTEENRIKRTYQRHNYQSEMRQAWQLLGERLEGILSGNSAEIIQLRKGDTAKKGNKLQI